MTETVNVGIFVPQEDFWAYLKKVPKTVVLVDCTNNERLLEEARNRLINIEPLGDANPETFEWSQSCWPLLCRPQGKWSQRTVLEARKNGAAVIYVGLKSDYRKSLGTNMMPTQIFGKIGLEGEVMYLIRSSARSSLNEQAKSLRMRRL